MKENQIVVSFLHKTVFMMNVASVFFGCNFNAAERQHDIIVDK